MTTATKTRSARVKTKTSAMDVHHMLRTISFFNTEAIDGALPVDVVDDHIRTWLDAGYELFAAHYAGETPNGLRILYIFIKKE